MAVLEGKIKTPFGEMDKKWALGGLVVAGGVVTIAYIRHRNSSGSASTGSSGASSDTTGADTSGNCTDTDPAGNVGCIDPQTGYVYGSPQDQANLQGGATQDYSSGYGGMPYGYGGDSGFPGGGAGGDCFDANGNIIPCPGTGTTPKPKSTTKEQWVQKCITDLHADADTFETLSAKIFADLRVTTAQKTAFMECVGINGQPPGGYPSPIKTTDTSSHPKTHTVKVPKVTGEQYAVAAAKLTAKGLKPKRATPDVGLVEQQSPEANKEVRTGTVVTLTGKPARRLSDIA